MRASLMTIDENGSIWQANKAKFKTPNVFPKIPGSKIMEYPVPKNPEIEILDPVRACSRVTLSSFALSRVFFEHHDLFFQLVDPQKLICLYQQEKAETCWWVEAGLWCLWRPRTWLWARPTLPGLLLGYASLCIINILSRQPTNCKHSEVILLHQNVIQKKEISGTLEKRKSFS